MRSRSKSSSKKYYLSRTQLESLLKDLGIVISGDTSSDIIAYCCFHKNLDSPAFNISTVGPHLWRCHNGKCGKQGNILTLLMLKGYTKSEAEKMLLRGAVEVNDLLGIVNDLLFPDERKSNALDEWKGIDVKMFANSDEKYGFPVRNYMSSRGITEDAVNYFQIGFSKKKDMAVIPVLDERKRLIGTIGREMKTKRYQYSTGLARKDVIWNLHNAKGHDSIILCEGSLDAVYVWQAGYENVGSVLGSAISINQWKLLKKYFTEVICFFDNDEAGQGLTSSIIDSVKDISVSYVEYPVHMGDSSQPKDPGDLSVDEIRHMVENRKSSLDLLLDSSL